MNALDNLRKLKEELKEEKNESTYKRFLIKGISDTVRYLNYQNKNKAKSIIMDYFNNVYKNEINSSKPQNYLNALKKLKYYSELNLLSNLSLLETVINDLEKDYPMLDVLKDGFMIKASEKILKNLEYNINVKDPKTKDEVLENACKAVIYLGTKMPDKIREETNKLLDDVLSILNKKGIRMRVYRI